MKLCPEAKIDDGLLDVTYVQNIVPEKVPELLQVVALGGKQQDDLSESIKTMRVPWLEVRVFVLSGLPDFPSALQGSARCIHAQASCILLQ